MGLKIGKLRKDNKIYIASSTFLKVDNKPVFIIQDDYYKDTRYYSQVLDKPEFDRIKSSDLDKYTNATEIYYIGIVLCMLIENVLMVREVRTKKQLDNIVEKIYKHNDKVEEAVKNIRIE